MELLAPAGGEEQLEYAMRFGADAVYLACERFGMRARATNFALADLPRVVQKAHAGGVRVHVTCNAVMHPEDAAQLPDFLEQVAAAGADALIVGDLGAAALARKHAPNVALHVSTQASVCNAHAAKVWHDLGATRIVAAREMSLAELADLKRNMPAGMELEAFVHGAMCVAYSGRCLISDFMNGRSGIRGNCAQSCRWEYALMESWRPGQYYPVEEDATGSYILNADDLCMLEHLDALAQAGVDSVKIEGRTKKAFYVATVVNAYRQVLDGAPASQFMPELECVSHRPYSTGFYFGRGTQTPENLVYTRNARWAAQVLESQPMGEADGVGETPELGNAGEAPEPGVAAERESGEAGEVHAGREAGAAQVACAGGAVGNASEGRWRIKFKCRDRFSPTDCLEALSPHQPVRPVTMTQLMHDPLSRTVVLTDGGVNGWQPRQQEPYAVDVADHPAEHYFALVDVPLQAGDIIRVLDSAALT